MKATTFLYVVIREKDTVCYRIPEKANTTPTLLIDQVTQFSHGALPKDACELDLNVVLQDCPYTVLVNNQTRCQFCYMPFMEGLVRSHGSVEQAKRLGKVLYPWKNLPA